ncbi:MAG: hypothetical protein KAV82_12460 [Phycisphaerae bacterium]|nr:hypothetical protein [Phycisphaerae bacterium]
MLTAILAVLAFGCGLWAWKHPEQLATIGQVLKYVAIWLGIVLVLPWAMFPAMPWVLKWESNLAAGLLLVGITGLDVTAALLMTGVSGLSTLTWLVLVLGFLSAGVYTFMACNYQANRIEDSI